MTTPLNKTSGKCFALLATVTLVLIATPTGSARPVGGVASAAPRPHYCGKYQADHRTWGIATTGGFSCNKASQILRQLAGKRVPAQLAYPGLFGGLRCTAGPPPGGRAERIFCWKSAAAFRGPGFMAAAKA